MSVESVELKQSIKRTLQPILPPPMVQGARVGLWYLSSYFPRLVTSRIVKRTPEVRGVGAARSHSHLAEQLQRVNVLAPTKICRVMTNHGSDKARAHNYTTVYSALFGERWKEPLRIFELGLGSNNPGVPSNMGTFGVPGASHRGWRKLFPHALVYGADVDRGILFHEDRIKTFYCDQLDPLSIRQLWAHPDLQGGMDIIIEDGLHTFEANVSFLEGSLDQLRPGGIYVVEDISSSDVMKWYERLDAVYAQKYPKHEFAFAILPDDGNWANNMLVVRRGQD